MPPIPLGGTLPIDLDKARTQGEEWFDRQVQRTSQQQPGRVDAARADYAAAYNSTSLVPVGAQVGVPLPYGRCWAEARSITHSGGSGSVDVVLIATQNGVRCTVTAPPGQTISGGSVRFWVFDENKNQWSLGPVEETLATGAQSVSTSDQFVTVGAA